MPTYQYACTECGNQLEAVQSFSDPSLVECPVCSGRLRKLFGAVGIVFKGSGFYRTDSRASATGGAGKSEVKSESTVDASSGTKDSGTKDSGAKDSGTKDSGPKDSSKKDGGSKDTASKDSGSKSDSGANSSTRSDSSRTSTKTATPAGAA